MSAWILGHKNPDSDNIISALACADLYRRRGLDVQARAQGKPAPETQFILDRFGLEGPEVIDSVAGQDLYLVDFSDKAQAPSDIDQANLKGIVDHHKLGDVTSSSPVECIIWPVGCTCTILKRMYDYAGFEIPAPIAGIMLSAILSDTVIFKSPTCTQADRDAAQALAQIAGIENIEAFGMEIFKAKSAVAGTSPRDLIFRDFKDFNMNGVKVGVGQLELVSLDLVADMKASIEEELARVKSEEGRHTALLLLTDIMKEGSELLMVSDDPVRIAKAFGHDEAELANGHLWLDGVMSRKKQVVPALEAAFKA